MRLEPRRLSVGGVLAVRVDGQVLPVVRLGERLGLPQLTDSTTRLLPIVVVQAGERQVAFVVDELIGAREVVVKTLGSHLRRVHGVIGSTLMGDGSVVLILNPVELARDEQQQVAVPRKVTAKPRATRAREVLDILIVDDSFSVRRVVSTLIKSVGWNPILAKDGLEALDIMQRATTPPDLILLDVEMPDGRLRVYLHLAGSDGLSSPADRHADLPFRREASPEGFGGRGDRVSRQAVPR